MKYLKQFGIIAALSFIGEFLNFIVPLPIPASIYGLLLLLFCLSAKVLKVESVKETALFLIEIMPVMFIPAAVGLVSSWDMLKSNLAPYLIITAVSTFAVMGVSGHVTQFFLRRGRMGKGEGHV